MRRCLLLLFLVADVLLIAGCGSAHHSTVVKLHAGPAACNPPAGQGHVGVCTPKPVTLNPSLLGRVSGRLIPDVYEGDGCKNWAVAKGSIAGAIVKAYEFRADQCLAHNWRQLTSLHIWHAAYDFLRPGSCTGEADRYVAVVRAAGGFNSGPPIADAEVPLPAGFVACWVNRTEHDTGSRSAVVYTSPGTWPGGGRPANALLWEANYGATPDCVWTCSRVAWQFTDGIHGPDPHCTAVGCGDVSLDAGITSLLAKPAPARLVCFGQHATPNAAKCKPVLALYRKRARAINATKVALAGVKADLASQRCRKPYHRQTCRTLGRIERTLTQRLAWFTARQAATRKAF